MCVCAAGFISAVSPSHPMINRPLYIEVEGVLLGEEEPSVPYFLELNGIPCVDVWASPRFLTAYCPALTVVGQVVVRVKSQSDPSWPEALSTITAVKRTSSFMRSVHCILQTGMFH